MPLYKREYFCTSCGIKINRDANSARNLLLRYIARQEPEKLLGAYSVLGVRPRNRVFITTWNAGFLTHENSALYHKYSTLWM